MKKAIYKIIEDVSIGLSYEHMIITINKIKQIESKFIANEEIDVIYELSRYSNRYKADNRTSIPQVVSEYLWEIIIKGKKGGYNNDTIS
jgi:hypothetical protein